MELTHNASATFTSYKYDISHWYWCLIKHYHKLFHCSPQQHQVNIAQPKHTQIHKPSDKLLNTVKGQLKLKQILFKSPLYWLCSVNAIKSSPFNKLNLLVAESN